MFPVRDEDGRVLGFAGLATHLGPSWPLWLASPNRGAFDGASALFGFDRAAPAIAEAGRALVLRDCVQVLARHQRDHRDAVAVIQSPITREHTVKLARALRTPPDNVRFARRDGRLGVVVVPEGTAVADDDFAPPATPAGFALIDAERRAGRAEPPGAAQPAALEHAVPPTRRIVYLAGAVIGVGIPLGLLAAGMASDETTRGSAGALNVVIIGVVVSYIVLTLAVARISARVRERSQERRMREPWARGSDEWQPSGWTYHRLEEILVGAALASAITCVVLLVTVGGFLG